MSQENVETVRAIFDPTARGDFSHWFEHGASAHWCPLEWLPCASWRCPWVGLTRPACGGKLSFRRSPGFAD